ncbi:hypothetical protein CEXT_634491 [Caerostris extrusa]|uniref:Uncharacterized protein n=1 Tax=Caerostris extrusa TaxID=172846 RepID=A0AAV4R5V6_CAEEX|nr:hypothetical protein CEXT_634491 [Caerostris extrusa]
MKAKNFSPCSSAKRKHPPAHNSFIAQTFRVSGSALFFLHIFIERNPIPCYSPRSKTDLGYPNRALSSSLYHLRFFFTSTHKESENTDNKNEKTAANKEKEKSKLTKVDESEIISPHAPRRGENPHKLITHLLHRHSECLVLRCSSCTSL